jgi:TrmH family RNA methyltransferase
MTEIQSKQNPRYKFACSLQTKRGRDNEQAFLVEGKLEIQACLAAENQVLDLFYCPENASDGETNLVTAVENYSDLRRAILPQDLMDKLSYRRSCGLVVLSKTPQVIDPDQMKRGLVLILEEPSKPGNLGAIVRTASGFGASGVVTIGNSVDRWNSNAIRSSIGSIFSMPVVQYPSWDDFLSDHQELTLVGMHPDGRAVDGSLTLPKSIGVVFGTESKGLSQEAQKLCSSLIKIPMLGVVDSLNLSVCAGVVAYAWSCCHIAE